MAYAALSTQVTATPIPVTWGNQVKDNFDALSLHLHSGAAGDGGLNALVYKSADETVNASAALQNDDHLSVAVTTGQTYFVMLRLYVTSASGTSQGLRGAFTFPAASTATGGMVLHSLIATAEHQFTMPAALTTGTAFFTGGAAYLSYAIDISAYFVFTASGTLQFQWAQDTAHASNTTVEAGSYMLARRVA